MRLFKLKNKTFNWKYVLGEILLLFIGINLAIWFNNWNATKKMDQEKKIAITKIAEEIENNIEELEMARENNQFIVNAYNDFQKIYEGNTSILITSPDVLENYNKKYPEFFMVNDSVKRSDGLYRYAGTTHILLELPTLTEIAWETTRAISITNEFNYECLYELESMYHIQRRVQLEVDKASEALQKRELKELMNILGFLNQLDVQLKESYVEVLTNIENCN